MKNNILKELIKSTNYIFISIYLIITLTLLSAVRIIISNKYILIIRYIVLSYILIKGILNYNKYKKNKNKTYKIDKRYILFFEKEYIKTNKQYIFYILEIIFFIFLLTLSNSYGLYYIWISFIIGIIILIIRKIIIKKEYNHLKIEEINIDEAHINIKQKLINLTKIIIFYLITCSLITYLFCKLNNAFNSWYIITGLFLILFIFKLIINNPLNEFYDLKKKMFSVKIYNIFIFIIIVLIIYIGMIIGVYKLRPYIDNIKKAEVNNHKIIFEDNIYKIYKGSEDFKVLQLSDIHIGGSIISYNKDLKALQTIEKLVNYTKPDLIIVTGDLIYPTPIQSFYLNNQTAMYQLSLFFNNLSVPWAFTYGNHETEIYAFKNAKDLENTVYNNFSKMYNNENSLLYYNANDYIHGRNNMIIEIINPDNTINQILYLLDSGDYYSRKLNDYDYIRDDQVDWYKSTLKEIGTNNSSMLFFHMPLKETKEAVEKYKNNSDEVTYYFGKVNEKICSSKYKSKIFEEAVNLKSTKAIFYGHDHKNNISLEYKGIRLTYGMSIDYIATPGIENTVEYRGATLITLKDKSNFDIRQIKLTDIN